MHGIDGDVDRGFRRRPPGEDGVQRLDRLALVTGQSGDDRLREQLAAEDDVVAGADVAGAVAVRPDALQRQRAEDGVDAEPHSSRRARRRS